jgi:hypothetical protein
MSDPEAPQEGTPDVGTGRIASPEMEIKDAPLIFGQIWNGLVQERSLDNMVQSFDPRQKRTAAVFKRCKQRV